ncbi:uncharacterized protein LOC122803869 [Protopterus annectens]|uniref:uncharacterized protein LOC122803869 n=1 Tax=Protopterus annectens TaxID=7888 RepID=UPI001CF9EF1B|nr:uncharacterized protein LOC122803869 [Protopterus annectens]
MKKTELPTICHQSQKDFLQARQMMIPAHIKTSSQPFLQHTVGESNKSECGTVQRCNDCYKLNENKMKVIFAETLGHSGFPKCSSESSDIPNVMTQGANSVVCRNYKMSEFNKNKDIYDENWKFQHLCMHEENHKIQCLYIYEDETVSSVKTIIAPSVGTAKSVAMFKRPEPPKRPRANRSVVRQASPVDKRLTPERKGPGLANERKHKTRHRWENKESSSKSKKSEESSTSDLGYNEVYDYSKLKAPNSDHERKTSGPASGKELEIPEHKEKCGIINGSGLRSTQELLEEAENITNMNTAKISETKFQPKMPQENIFSANLPARATARSVDEIIASLRSTGYSASQSASDQMIKELMEKVLGHDKSSMNEEVLQSRSEKNLEVPQSGSEMKLVDNEAVKLEQTSSVFENKSQEMAQEFPTELPVQKSEEMASINEQDPSKNSAVAAAEEADSPPTSSVSPEVCHNFVSEESESLESFMDKEDMQRKLSLPAQVTYSDIMYVKGAAVKMTEIVTTVHQQKEEEERHKRYIPFSLLATWTPKDKDYHFETIHHICTATPSHVLPTELHFASRMYFTSNHKNTACSKMYHTVAELLCQKEVFHENVSSEEHCEVNRVLHEGISVSEVSKESLTDSVKVIPPHTCESLAEWQKIAEYYVEGPRLELVGERANIYPDATKMFWTPAPPKFAAPVSLVQETVFPKYQAIVNDYEINVEEPYINIQCENEDIEDEKQKEEDRAALVVSDKRKLNYSLPEEIQEIESGVEFVTACGSPDTQPVAPMKAHRKYKVPHSFKFLYTHPRPDPAVIEAQCDILNLDR